MDIMNIIVGKDAPGRYLASKEYTKMISTIEFKGKLLEECMLPGERYADDVFPGHPNGMLLSRNVWMLVYCTRGWRAVDDDRSVVYQLRRGGLDGTLIKEGFFRRRSMTGTHWVMVGGLSANRGILVFSGSRKGR
jgi:hypothetical protein